MPYAIEKMDGKFAVVNTDTGAFKSKSTTKGKAQKQINLLRGIEHGWKPASNYQDFVKSEFKKRPATIPASEYMKTIAAKWRQIQSNK